ncbi:MAG: 4Fe-4S dicluster domain-containing protein [Bacteroidales bacterium]
MAKVNPDFLPELKQYGGVDFSACYNCGNCTAICSLSTPDSSFPRMMVRASVVGLEDKIKGSLDPWLCYYCGDCSTYCPRGANPGELMMALRRWLTAKYDWTGLSGLLYKYMPLTLTAFLLTALAVIGIAFRFDFNLEPIMHFGHKFELFAILTVFAVILLPNLFRMYYFLVLKPRIKVPLKTYVNSLGELFIHMFTQKRTLGCDDSKTRWFAHLVLVLGYLSLLFTTVFLDWFGTSNMFVIVFGYVVSAVVFFVTFIFMRGRAARKQEIHKFSQPSDWLFVVWLFLMGFTAFLVRLFIDLQIIEHHLWLYLFHLIVLVQWAVLIVPFGKWTHFLYRSFAMYFEKLLKPQKVTKK